LIVTFNSYKGGTGKTLLSTNLAILFATMGKRVCLLDLDLRAPSVYLIFKNGKEYWVNDYLNKACNVEDVLTDCSTKDMGKGKLLVGLANPSTEAILEMETKNTIWETEALGRLLSLKTYLLNGMPFDYLFLDTSPGLIYSSINAIVCADVVLVVTSTDKSDVEGTRRMIRECYELFDMKIGIIINKVPTESLSLRIHNNSIQLGTHQLPIIGVIPCSCDVATKGRNLFVFEKLNHPFTEKLQEIATNLELIWGATKNAKMTTHYLVSSESGLSPNLLHHQVI
jgi:MinD-like ATPase involved in chromosome partitioning or flagellar assembly